MRDTETALTQSALRARFTYDPETGEFFSHFVKRTVGSQMHDGYVRIEIDGRDYMAHRLAWLYVTGLWPAEQIDHRNHDRSDNRWENLRACNISQNRCHTKALTKSNSGYRGVHLHTATQRFHARIKINGKQQHIGCFSTAIEAASAYDRVARKHHGEFARVNGVTG